ncbi:MAG: hypothetical protein R3326_04190 [Gemmatimonadota bacterium]|nr:hypothetical protein [Gemmatimonadota bacterium]
MRLLTFLFVVLLALPSAARGQDSSVLGGRSLLEWMGLEPGDTQVFALGDERTCVTVQEPFSIDGRAYAELRGLRWPGLASDSRLLVPLDGSIGLSVIATPGPRPNPRPLLASVDTLRWGLPAGVELGNRSEGGSALWNLRDGWYAVGPRNDPRALVHVRCSMCADAGTRVVLEKDRGIRSVTRTTIAGTETLSRLPDSSCAERAGEGVEFELYVLPQDERRP